MQNNTETLNKQKEQLEALTTVLEKEVEFKEAVRRFFTVSDGYDSLRVEQDYTEVARAVLFD